MSAPTTADVLAGLARIRDADAAEALADALRRHGWRP